MVWRVIGTWSQPMLGFANWALTPIKPWPKKPTLPGGVGIYDNIPNTSEAELSSLLEKLDSKKAAWARLGASERAALLRECLFEANKVSQDAAKVQTLAKGSYSNGSAEELLTWVPIAAGIREFAESLEAGGQLTPNDVIMRPGGQLVVDVFPRGLVGMLFGGWKGEVWIQPGKPATQGKLYRDKATAKSVKGGEVALVLGAGNQVAVVALDILHKLVVQDSVVICKMNPVNQYAGPFLRKAFSPLVEAGYLEIVYGGVREGSFLTQHPLIGSVHLTGSPATYDAIVWGHKEKVGDPPLKKPVGAELGCVTPYIVTPGEWTRSELEYHADLIASALSNNAGHNCVKAEIIVTARDWPQREAFVDILRKRLAALPRRYAFYPGSKQRYADFSRAFPDAEELGTEVGDGTFDTQPWLFRAGLSPSQARTDVENWCGVLQEVAIPGTGPSPAAFLEKATDFVNNRCWGTLSCALIVHPSVEREHPEAVDKAIAGLRYGSVCVNTPCSMGFGITSLTWGAFPGNTPQDIGSGNCWVHNTLLLDHPQKSVLRAPFRVHPTPLWSPQHRNLEAVAGATVGFMAAPGLMAMNSCALAALRG